MSDHDAVEQVITMAWRAQFMAPTVETRLEVTSVAGQTHYLTARRNAKGVELQSNPESEGKKLIAGSTAVTARFFPLRSHRALKPTAQAACSRSDKSRLFVDKVL
jgi:hypothetical protein